MGAFDAVLAATARGRAAAALASADRHFADVAGLEHVVPVEGSLDRLLDLP